MTKRRTIPALLLLTGIAWWSAYLTGEPEILEMMAALGFTLACLLSMLRGTR